MLWLATASAGFAQNARSAGEALTGLRPVSAREGQDIALATAWLKSVARRWADCSHLVHDVYEQAGYPYPYVDSSDLYNGSENFARVRVEQPGDLIVWRGHVGIVVDAKEHAFFSTTRSGPRTAYYDSAYWRARGRARFYRYLTDSPVRARGAATEMEARAQGPEAPEAGKRRPEHRPAIQPVKTAPAAAVKARSQTGPASVARAEIAPEPLLHVSGKRQPRAADVAAALAEMNQAAGELLGTGNLEQLGQTVIVYRDLQVTGVEIKGKHGAAQVEIESLAVLSRGRMESQRGWEALRPELQRTKKGWVIAAANENVYVPRDAALRILAARLASLTQVGFRDSDGVSRDPVVTGHRTAQIGDADSSAAREREQGQIIRFLSLLAVED